MLASRVLRCASQVVRTVSQRVISTVPATRTINNSSVRFFNCYKSRIPPTTVRVDVRFEEIIRISTSQLPAPRETIRFTHVKKIDQDQVRRDFRLCAVLYNLEQDASKKPNLKAVHLYGNLGTVTSAITYEVNECCKVLHCNKKIELLKNFSKDVENSKNGFDLLRLMQDKQVIAALKEGGVDFRGHDQSLSEMEDCFRRDVENHSLILRARTRKA